MPKFSNELINEKSLYLLKHAHNPVKWQSWNEETLKKAKKKKKNYYSKYRLLYVSLVSCHGERIFSR